MDQTKLGRHSDDSLFPWVPSKISKIVCAPSKAQICLLTLRAFYHIYQVGGKVGIK